MIKTKYFCPACEKAHTETGFRVVPIGCTVPYHCCSSACQSAMVVRGMTFYPPDVDFA